MEMRFGMNVNQSIPNKKISQRKINSVTLYPFHGLLLVFFILICNTGFVSAIPNTQKGLVPVEGDLGYKQRGKNRKEGFYEKRTGGSLEVVSLLYGTLSYDWAPDVVLNVVLPVRVKQVVNVRARAIPLKTYYQMDGIASSKEPLTWPINDVLYKSRLKANMIGVYGWLGAKSKKKFVPLYIYQQGKAKINDQKIFLGVRADVDVEKVIYRFSKMVDGKNQKSGEGWNVIDHYINAGHGILIKLPERKTGELCVEMKAKSGSGSTWLPLKITVYFGKTE